jgi:hypothetical protein
MESRHTLEKASQDLINEKKRQKTGGGNRLYSTNIKYFNHPGIFICYIYSIIF